MSQFRYIGNCSAGYVEFNNPNLPSQPSVVMPQGEDVEVPDWLAAKLKTNDHFEQVTDDATIASDGTIEAKPASKKQSKKKQSKKKDSE